ncbi:MAG: proton-conducting membrane transporter [Eubacteriales bacterium]|nr:proton-conducting membrane transporter [Eubacteriales bacterium]
MLPMALALPFIGGGLIFLLRVTNHTARNALSFVFTLGASVFAALAVFSSDGQTYTLAVFSDTLSIAFRMDGLARVFTGLTALLWPLSTLYAFEYMQNEGHGNPFFGFYLLSFGVTLAIATAANLFTLYIFYELLTFSTLFLVAHGLSARSVYAARKYLYYSLGGAALAFVAMIGALHYGGTTAFTYGGIAALLKAPRSTVLALFTLGFLGFGVKAAVFPLHGWLPTATVAPTPVTALLHAVAVVKAGVFSIARLAYFVYGAKLLSGSWAQTVCLSLALFTILFGSVMAVREQHLKRRLAYSTVSNLSYVLFGVLLMTPEGLTAGLMHMVFHALMKIALFSCVGAWMIRSGKSYVQDLRGMGRRMPFIFTIFAFCAVELVGIPPFIGFQSKWALATAGLAGGTALGFAGTGVLIISAVLTAIYLLPPAVTAFALPPNDAVQAANESDPGWRMKLPLILLCLIMLALVFFSGPLIQFLSLVASGKL